MDKKEIRKLLNDSKTFCILPWIHLNVMPDSSVIPCCISPYKNHYGNGTDQSLIEIWNSEKFKKLRLDMISEVKSNVCSRCYKLEEAGFSSMRKSFNSKFKDQAKLVNQTKVDGALDTVNLKYIDIRFSNLCNFSCRGCSPALSSSWYEDHQLLYNYKSNDLKVKSVSSTSPSFWNELMSASPLAEEIYFGGGEPLITREHFELLKRLESMKKFKIRLSYNTNLSQLSYGNYDIAKIWKKFRHVRLGISIDDIGNRAEYFRKGTKWEIIERNMINLRDNYKNINLYINCTVNIMNVLYIPEIVNYLMQKKIIDPSQFNINLLLDPPELSIQALPHKLKDSVTVKLNSFIVELELKKRKHHKLITDMKKILNFMNEDDKSNLLSTFKSNTLLLDQIRNENFLVTYPELEELIQNTP